MTFEHRVHGVVVGLSLLFGASACGSVVIVEGGERGGVDQGLGSIDPDAPSSSDPGTGSSSRPDAVLEDCATEAGYSLSTYLAAKEGSPALRVVGVYETRSDHSANNHPTGSATVSVERPGSTVLVLSSYEPTAWTVTAGPATTIERVILNGYHAQTATVPPGIAVEDHSGINSYFSACGYEWPNGDGGCDTPALIAGAEKLSGLNLTSFHGCYRMTKFVYLPEK